MTKVVMESVNVVINDESTNDQIEEEQAKIEGEQASISEDLYEIPS